MGTTPILDAFPYPFDRPMAHELVNHLMNQFPDEDDARAFAAKHGVDLGDIKSGQSPRNRWRSLLKAAAVAGGVRTMVEEARDLQPKNPRVAFLDALLADKEVPVSAEAKAKPAFGDTVTQKEALLFFDDLTIEIGRVAGLVVTLETLAKLAPGVCRLRVMTPAGEAFGTGFRIGRDVVLTNEHVLVPTPGPALGIMADFGFEVDAAGAMGTVTSLPGDLASVVTDAEDDWGIVRVPNMKDSWPIFALGDAPAPKPNDSAFILQHPSGQTKRLGYVRNLITTVTDRAIAYLTDTQPGSSGAPVLDAAGRVIALHYLGGEPIAIPGRGPVSKNEGIRISRILAGLAGKKVTL